MGKLGFSFSPKRAIGITKLKTQIARTTGIPTTRAGRQRKLGAAIGGGGWFFGGSRSSRAPRVVERVVYVEPQQPGGILTALRRLVGLIVLLIGSLIGVAAYIVWSGTNDQTSAIILIVPAGVLIFLGMRWMRRPASID